MSPRPAVLRAAALWFFLLLVVGQAALAVRTDVIVLRNGDHITGEVRELQSGRLRYKTDDMGTLYIEWLKVDELSSTTFTRSRPPTRAASWGASKRAAAPCWP